LYGVCELEFLCRGRETDALRRPAARPLVQDAQRAMRLTESRSRQSRNRLSVSRMALWASPTNGLTTGRRPASRSRGRDKHTRGQLLHAMHSPPCHNVLSTCHAHSPPLLPSSAEEPASLTASTWRREMAQCRQALHVVWLCCVGCSEVAYRLNMCEFEYGALGLDDVELLSAKQIRLT